MKTEQRENDITIPHEVVEKLIMEKKQLFKRGGNTSILRKRRSPREWA